MTATPDIAAIARGLTTTQCEIISAWLAEEAASYETAGAFGKIVFAALMGASRQILTAHLEQSRE